MKILCLYKQSMQTSFTLFVRSEKGSTVVKFKMSNIKMCLSGVLYLSVDQHFMSLSGEPPLWYNCTVDHELARWQGNVSEWSAISVSGPALYFFPLSGEPPQWSNGMVDHELAPCQGSVSQWSAIFTCGLALYFISLSDKPSLWSNGMVARELARWQGNVSCLVERHICLWTGIVCFISLSKEPLI